MEGSATLGSDTSAIPGLREAVQAKVLPFVLPLGNQSDNPRGLGQSPSGHQTNQPCHTGSGYTPVVRY